MTPTTEGTFRVFPGRTDDEWLLLEVDTGDPTYVPAIDAELAVGNRIDAKIEWEDEQPRLGEWDVVDRTRFHFRRTDAPVFQAAQGCFEAAHRAGEAMNARVTRDTDGRPNGVVYTFADQPGQRDLFGEFRDGEKPLEPLIERAAESEDPPFSVWVLDLSEPFVLVTIVLDPDGLFAETMAETYE
ncbi:DUF6663 family protein [Natronosalvus vescus]|uniref:DUF6663 family protein n=1 Tax=Natronosalvus vescus TaxID=2953881 RepID=UPI0020913C18|nr:DUF6663 family protein [Natronosalvus vescus]